MRNLSTYGLILFCAMVSLPPAIASTSNCPSISNPKLTQINTTNDLSNIEGYWIRPSNGDIRYFNGTANSDNVTYYKNSDSTTWATGSQSSATFTAQSGPVNFSCLNIGGSDYHSIYKVNLTTGAPSEKIMLMADGTSLASGDWFKFDRASNFNISGASLGKSFGWAADIGAQNTTLAAGANNNNNFTWAGFDQSGSQVGVDPSKVLLSFYNNNTNDANVAFDSASPINFVTIPSGAGCNLTSGQPSKQVNLLFDGTYLLFADDDENKDLLAKVYSYHPVLSITTTTPATATTTATTNTYNVNTPDPILVNKGAG